jgi:hypothetical protein
LLQEWVHFLPEIGQLGMGPFPPEKIAAEFAFELFDRAGERRLSHVTFFRRPREVERLGNPQEIPDLMHFHGSVPHQHSHSIRCRHH